MSHAVIWHELECGGYRQDLQLWLDLAGEHGAPILDIGAGTGRVSLALAKAGHEVVALDYDTELLDELTAQAEQPGGAAVATVAADARGFELRDRRFALIIAPMQTLQLLGGVGERARCFASIRAHLRDGGVGAVAIADTDDFEEFSWTPGEPFPLPDMTEIDGVIYSSQPTAVRREHETFVLERLRSVITIAGETETSEDRIALDVLPLTTLLSELADAGLRVIEQVPIPPTSEHIGSQVVIFGV